MKRERIYPKVRHCRFRHMPNQREKIGMSKLADENNRLAIGPFDLIKPIGKGSMGVVWEGVHRLQNVPVAVKVLTALGDQDEFRQSFTNEVRAVAKLHHPSIIRLLDYGMTDIALSEATNGQIVAQSPYYAMELATGGTLPRPKQPLAWPQMRYLLLELLDALAHAHARDVIHRDIKPSNILLMSEKNHTRAMLTDFGIAKAVGTKELPNGLVAGTPRYMAPEQILNQTRDQGPWTDLYSLGCLAYLFATGKRIFAHASGTEVLRCQIQETPDPVTGRHLPEGFQKWLSKMLAKKPSQRFEYAAEAAWELISLSNPELEFPELPSHEQNALPEALDSCDENVVGNPGSTSAIFQSLYNSDQLSLAVAEPPSSSAADNANEDIADDLLNDMGDTMRMDSEAIAKVISQQTQAAKARDEQEHELSTLAEIYKSRIKGAAPHTGSSVVPAPKTWRREAFNDQFGQLLGAGLGLWGLRTIPMVDRNHERDLIYNTLLATREDQLARCIILDGPRGTGKSRIIEWLSQRAHELSIAHTLKAIHYQDHIQAPGIARAMTYALVCQNLTRNQALERINAFLDDHPLNPEFDDALPMLEMMQLNDDPENPIPNIRFDDAEERYYVLARYLKRVSHDRPVILWLDDLHYSSFSMDFVHFVLTDKEASHIPILFLGTTRSEDLDPSQPLYRSYVRMLNSPSLTKVSINPLAYEDQLKLVHQLIGLDDALCQQVAQRTSGMPLFAIQIVGDWIERGILIPGNSGFTVKEGADIELPDSLHELWISRLNIIFKDIKRQNNARPIEQLEIAACLGSQFDADEWRIACEMAELGNVNKTLDCMLAHKLFEVKYPNMQFTHDLLRESLVRYARENQRLKDHHMICAEMLRAYFSEALTFYNERRAEHLYAAQAWESCIEPLLLAAQLRQQRCEFATAYTLLKQREIAIDACKADADSPIRALGWVAEANIMLQELKLEEAAPIIERSIALGLRIQSPVIQALAFKEKGILLNLRNNIGEAIDTLMISLSFFNQISERRRVVYQSAKAEALSIIGRICDARHELDLARNYLQQAIDIQSKTNDSYGLARSYKALGNTFQHGGLYEEARQNLEFALQIFQQMGYRLYIAHCLNDIGEIYRLGYKQLDQAEIWYRNAMDLYREINVSDGSTTVINLVMLLLAKQRFNEAKPLVLQQIEMLEKHGQNFDLNWLYAELLPCCAATFDWPTFDKTVLLLGKTLEDSMVVDADILYCTELASNLCFKYSTHEQGTFCREIAKQQAIRLNDSDAIARLNQK